MPLLKLWNSIWGRSTGEQTDVQQPASSRPLVSANKAASKPLSAAFSLFGGQNVHGALCKLAAATQARSVLEIGVGDGSRAMAVIGTLSKGGAPVRYFGIDQFELTGGAVSLKEFHRTLRAAGIRPQIFPEPIDRGLVRFLHTVGTVDLVLHSQGSETLDDPRIRQLLTRISHPKTTILCLRDSSWSPLASGQTTLLRAA